MDQSRKQYCFLDFDGTICDYSERMYRFYLDNLSSANADFLTLNEFWTLKRMGIHEAVWTNQKLDIGIDVKKWDERKKQLIETSEYLKYDRLFDYTINALDRLKRDYCLVMVTKRNNKDNLLKEIESFGIRDLFTDIIVISHYGITKQDAIRGKYRVTSDCIFVGDTEDDIIAGLDLGCRTYFVLSGIRGLWLGKKYATENVQIIDSIETLVK